MEQKKLHKNTTRTAQSHRTVTGRLLLMTLLLFTFLGGAKAQDQLTIPADGTTLTTNQYIPLYGYYADTDGCTSEFIIPTESIDVMADGDITAMTFYISQAAEAAWGATFQVYLGEVNGTTLSENYGPTDFIVVYEGELDGTGTTMTIEFEEPYHYNGGNLLVGTYVLSSGTFKRAYFSGYEATGAAYYSYESSWGNNDEVQNFIPKTTFTYEPAQQTGCAKPTGFAVNYNGGTTATVTWNGTASQYDIDVNGTVTEGVTSPYTLTNLELATTYQVKVRANCGGGEYSDYTSTKSFTTDACLPEDMCSITLALTDSYSDGWNGGKMQVVDATTGEVYGTYTIDSGSSAEYELPLCPGTVVNFVYTAGSYGTENGWVIYDAAGEVITEEAGCNSGCSHTNGVQATYTMNCSGCFKPKDLQASDITTNSATLSWTGNSESYVLQYSPWIPTGDDVLPTGTLQPYTFDLSQFSGTGSIVIRHYDVTNMFRLNIDDIEVVDADGEVVYSQDFENCDGVMPSEFTMMDMDGDGKNWYVVNSGKINGSYGLSSASWVNGDALFPDNWLVLSGIELGGSITFYACGQDANFPAENFNVYVCPDNAMFETSVNGTSYTATGLLPYTPVAWQVKGVCDEGETNFASSFFTTLDDILIFGTEGNWDELSNWTDVSGNAITVLPTINNKVRIDEDVTIPAGVVATAKKATLNGGTITIADGGQLKLDAITEVTMKKEIAGYDEGDANWNLIASPLTTTMLNYSEGWAYVNALTGTYDLYTFDPTQELEWINYQANSGHANFTSGNNNPVFVSMNGYFYGNEDNYALQFEGSTAYKSYNNVETVEVTYDATSTDVFNGWMLVGNPYTCNGYLMFGDAEGNMVNATFYKMNASGNGFGKYENYVMLAPGEGALIQYSTSGKVYFFSDDQGWTITSSGTGDIPVLPAHGEATDQDANPSLLILADNAANNSTLINAADGDVTNVMLAGRTLYKDGFWNTLTLPFDVNDLSGTPLAGATLMELNGTTSNLTDKTLTLYFEEATSISAGVPYIIKWNGDGTDNIVDPTFGGVTIPDNYDSAEAIADALVDAAVTFEGGQFVGTYSPLSYTEETESILFLGVDEDNNKSKLYWPAPNADNSTVTIGAFRAYFQMNDGAKIRAFRLNFGENGGEATGILSMENGQMRMENDSWYSVDGRKLLNAPKRKGVYIHNGTKVTIK